MTAEQSCSSVIRKIRRPDNRSIRVNILTIKVLQIEDEENKATRFLCSSPLSVLESSVELTSPLLMSPTSETEDDLFLDEQGLLQVATSCITYGRSL